MPLPQPGTYRARATSAKLGNSSKGTPFCAVTFDVLDEGPPNDGTHITAYCYLSDGAIKRSVESLRACGWEGDDLSDLSTVGSKECEIVVGEETYEGETRVKVKWINDLDRSGIALDGEMDQAAAKAFAASMRGKVLGCGVPPKPVAPKLNPPTLGTPPPTDDEPPF